MRDRGTAKQSLDQGYGLVCDIDGRPILDVIVIDTQQEHGVVAHRSGGKAPALPVGTRARILLNHACATGAPHKGYNEVEAKRDVIARWERVSGWQYGRAGALLTFGRSIKGLRGQSCRSQLVLLTVEQPPNADEYQIQGLVDCLRGEQLSVFRNR